MTLMDPLANALSTILGNEQRYKHECVAKPASKLLGTVLRTMQKAGYIGEFEFVDDGRSGKFKIQLLGRINRCGVIRPRFSISLDGIESFEKRYLPSRDVGLLVLTTPRGVMSHREAMEQRTGGRLLAYVY